MESNSYNSTEFYTSNYCDFDEDDVLELNETNAEVIKVQKFKSKKRKMSHTSVIELMSSSSTDSSYALHVVENSERKVQPPIEYIKRTEDVQDFENKLQMESRMRKKLRLRKTKNVNVKNTDIIDLTIESESSGIFDTCSKKEKSNQLPKEAHEIVSNLKKNSTMVDVHFACLNGDKTYKVEEHAEIKPAINSFCKEFNVDPDSLTVNGSILFHHLMAGLLPGVVWGNIIEEPTERVNIKVCYGKSEKTISVKNPLNLKYLSESLKDKFGYDKLKKIGTPDDEIKAIDFDQEVDVEEGDKIFFFS
eukprot:NODE_59_length_25653_cov_0.289622.p11 type:complete len:305 gc:universal NODE_59_length_25653_cov_0.289622:23951-23037(-)